MENINCCACPPLISVVGPSWLCHSDCLHNRHHMRPDITLGLQHLFLASPNQHHHNTIRVHEQPLAYKQYHLSCDPPSIKSSRTPIRTSALTHTHIHTRVHTPPFFPICQGARICAKRVEDTGCIYCHATRCNTTTVGKHHCIRAHTGNPC